MYICIYIYIYMYNIYIQYIYIYNIYICVCVCVCVCVLAVSVCSWRNYSISTRIRPYSSKDLATLFISNSGKHIQQERACSTSWKSRLNLLAQLLVSVFDITISFNWEPRKCRFIWSLLWDLEFHICRPNMLISIWL